MTNGAGSDSMRRAYKETVDYLFSMLPMFQRVGPVAYKKDLTNTLALLEALGNPEKRFRSIHVAGTNGKGSLTHLLAALFKAHGFKTGIYTSPHYKDFRERIKIGPDLIPKREVVAFVHRYKDLIEEVRPSFFELTVAMAFWYFDSRKVDIAIVETGLGGRLDSTNVLSPDLSVITNIGWDHMDLLGQTLSEIAEEKAGIIKPGVPVVIGEDLPETKPVFLQKAHNVGSPILFASECWQCRRQQGDLLANRMEFHSRDGRDLLLETDLTGPFQTHNFRTFLTVCDAMDQFGILSIQQEPLVESVRNVRTSVRYLGRWQVLGKDPLVLADSAHNRDGLDLLFQGVFLIPHSRLRIVLGVVADKELDKVLPLFPKDALYHFAKANVPRGLDAEVLRERCKAHDLQGKAYRSVRSALNAAKRKAQPNDLILVCGSIFVVAEVI